MFLENNKEFMELTTDFMGPDLYSSTEGFIHGNMFKDEYKGYKNYQVKTPKAKTEQEAYLYKIMELEFAINDLNLYLDLHNDDKETFKLFKRYIDEEKKLKDKYIKEYGPLTLEDTLGNNFNWINDFPWENKRGDMYV